MRRAYCFACERPMRPTGFDDYECPVCGATVQVDDEDDR